MKLEKIQSVLSEDVRAWLDKADSAILNSTIAEAEEAIDKAKRERDALPAYVAAKQAITDLSQALKEVKTYQGAKIHYSLRLKRIKNGEDVDGA